MPSPWSLRCICSLSAVWPSVWLIIGAHHLYPVVQEGLRERTARHLCSSLRSCARCGGSPTPICATGYARGPPLPSRAACPYVKIDTHAARDPPHRPTPESLQESPFQKPSSFSI